jgi:hypothetical protein
LVQVLREFDVRFGTFWDFISIYRVLAVVSNILRNLLYLLDPVSV